MKATLEFDLNDKDDRLDHFRSIMSREMSWALSDMLQLVKKLEYFEDDPNTDKHQYINHLRETISETFNKYDLDINQLIY